MRRLAAAFWLAMKHAWYNRRLEAGILLGLCTAAGVASAIPIYTSGALQRGLIAEWRARAGNRPPYAVLMSLWDSFGELDLDVESYQALEAYVARALPERVGQAPLQYARAGGLGTNRIYSVDPMHPLGDSPYADLAFLSNLREHTRLVDGRWPALEPRPDGVVEVVVDVAAIDYLGVLVGEAYDFVAPLPGPEGGTLDIRLEVVGAFRADEAGLDTRNWIILPPFDRFFFLPERTFKEHLVAELGLRPATLDWYWVFDESQVQVHELEAQIEALREALARAAQIQPGVRYWYSPLSVFERYRAQAGATSAFLLALSLPVLGVVVYFTVLTAGLAVANRGNEIATLRSRGATAWQILLQFFLEWTVLGLIAFAVGPWIGLGIAQVLGASAGFLSFVGRTALPVALHRDAYLYGGFAACVAVLAALLPVFPFTRYSIVTFKHRLARKPRTLPWSRFFPDVLLLAAAYAGYRQLAVGVEAGGTLPIDPSLYLVPFLFLLGGALLFVRVFPWLMTLAGWVRFGHAGVSWALTVRQMGRNPAHYAPLLILMTVTVSSGIYAASAARTLGQNRADRIGYGYGADTVLREQWRRPAAEPSEMITGEEEGEAPPPDLPAEEEVFEPPFYVHQSLPGVTGAARVLKRDVTIRAGGRGSQGQLMALVPHEFAAVAWWRDGLLRYHRNAYLNLLLQMEEAALVSRDFMEAHALEPGDWISIAIGREQIELLVAAAVDYWPTLDPGEAPFIVANLDYIQDHTPLEPYEVWLDLAPGAQLQAIVDGLREEGVYVVGVEDARRALVEACRDPLNMGFFGILSIGFLVSVAATVGGFFLFHFLSMRNRALQLGVLRSMGLSVGQLVGHLVLEGLFSVGLGLLAGTVLGTTASRIFLPFLEAGSAESSRLPPFRVVVDGVDVRRIYIVLFAMLIAGVTALAVALIRIRLDQAVKLGEET